MISVVMDIKNSAMAPAIDGKVLKPCIEIAKAIRREEYTFSKINEQVINDGEFEWLIGGMQDEEEIDKIYVCAVYRRVNDKDMINIVEAQIHIDDAELQ